MKTITVCGSLKFKNEMMSIALKMELEGNNVLVPICPVYCDKDSLSEEEGEMLGKMHLEKIKISDAILVTNVGGYIGESTKKEIELAKSLNKEIIYYTDLVD